MGKMKQMMITSSQNMTGFFLLRYICEYWGLVAFVSESPTEASASPTAHTTPTFMYFGLDPL